MNILAVVAEVIVLASVVVGAGVNEEFVTAMVIPTVVQLAFGVVVLTP